MMDEAWLDISILKCPNCGKIYADASWYVVVMESDIECNICGNIFNTTRNLIDRVLLRISIEGNRVKDVEIGGRPEE